MPKYLIHGSYTVVGVQGLLEEGGSKRRQATERATTSLGGTLEAYYFGFGPDDFYALVDLPDNVTAAAASLVGNASGAIEVTVTVLLTPEEVDEAARKTMEYRPPGR